jgi:hypothetical protein
LHYSIMSVTVRECIDKITALVMIFIYQYKEART